jgi:S1-C subfamily serine protease
MRSRLALNWILRFLLLALFTALPHSALALTASQVYEQVKDSVVVVKAYDQTGKPVGLGSGVMLPSGDVITNYHVAKAGGRYMVGQGKKGVPATLKADDPAKDLCLLSAPGLAAKPARLGRAGKLKVGEPVYAVGAPQGLELSLSEGIVSQLRGGPPPLIQTTVAISQGSSGGGLFNAEGKLVGITTFYLKDSQSLNFAVPMEWIGEVAGRKPPERGATVDNKYTLDDYKAELARGKTWRDRAVVLNDDQDWQGLLEWSRQKTKVNPWQRIRLVLPRPCIPKIGP